MPVNTFYLVMTFETSTGRTSNVTVKDIKADISESEIRTIVQTIVSTNIFEGGTKAEPAELVKGLKAEIVNKEVIAHDLRPQA